MKALITGVSGQLGFYLAHLLHREGHAVFGMIQPQAGAHLPFYGADAYRVKEELPWVTQVEGDLTDFSSLQEMLDESDPEVVFSLASISQPRIAEIIPETVMQVNGLGIVRLLKAVEERKRFGPVRFVHASSDAIFGDKVGKAAETPIAPLSMYGLSKTVAHLAVKAARAKGLWAVNSILCNMLSSRQTTGLIPYLLRSRRDIKEGKQERVMIRSLQVRRDYLFSGDVAAAMIHHAQADEPQDMIVGSDETHTVSEVCSILLDGLGKPWDQLVMETGPHDDLSDPWGTAATLRSWGWRASIDFHGLLRWLLLVDEGQLPPDEEDWPPVSADRVG